MNFINDYEKLLDMRIMSKEEFLASYSYLTEEEYDATTAVVETQNGLHSYKMSEHILNLVRKKDELMFRMAISHLMDVGIRHLTDENVEATCEEIVKEDDRLSFMTNRYKCDLVRMAAQLARIDHIHLLVYIQRNVEYAVDGYMDY